MAEGATTRKCTRCAAPVDLCAFCDEPDCASVLCNRCVRELFLDRISARPASLSRAAAQAPTGSTA